MSTAAVSLVLLLTTSAVSAAAPARAERRAPERLVTLQVKDASVDHVIRSLKTQCAVKNVAIDPDVSGRASFFFRDLPCSTAWSTVLRTYGLAVAGPSQNMMHVEPRR